MYKQLSMAVTLCTLAGGISTAQAQVMCGDVITTSEVLTSDLNCSGFSPALTIQGPGGRLEMRRFTVSCQGSFSDGIRLTGTGALLQNGIVSDCLEGVDLDGSNHRVLNGMIVENNGDDGVDIDSGSGHQIRQTTSRNNGSDGFEVGGDGNNQFDRNRATGNDDDGFDVFQAANNTFTRNVATGGNNQGFKIQSDNNLLTQNAAQNSLEGILVIGSNNTISRSNVRNNLDDGIEVVEGALNNTLKDNIASGNGSADLDADGGFDLEDDNVNCDANTWTNNRGTRNQLCIQ